MTVLGVSARQNTSSAKNMLSQKATSTRKLSWCWLFIVVKEQRATHSVTHRSTTTAREAEQVASALDHSSLGRRVFIDVSRRRQLESVLFCRRSSAAEYWIPGAVLN